MNHAARSSKPSRSPHGELLAMLAAKVPGSTRKHAFTIGAVVAKLCGGDSEGRLAQTLMLDALCAAPTLHTRRQLLEHFIRSFEYAHKHGAQWRVTGAEAFVGHQHLEELPAEQRPPAREFIDPVSGEVRHRPYRKALTRKTWRPHCPSTSAGGIAAHSGRSPKQLGRYREKWRRTGLWRSEQPTSGASDAVLPRKRPRHSDGKWAYGQHWLGFEPPPAMRRRWHSAAKARKQARAAVPPRPRGPWSSQRPPRVGELLDLRDLAERE